MCSKCKTRQRCTKFFSIQRFPKYLVIHLKRFSQERYRAKISSLVDYPVDGLDLHPFAADQHGNSGPRPVYNLYAVCCHAGSTHCGHYTAFCKHPVSGRWNEYNDSRYVRTAPALYGLQQRAQLKGGHRAPFSVLYLFPFLYLKRCCKRRLTK